jgi:hypothetical protein
MAAVGMVVALGGVATAHAGTVAPPETSTEAPAAEGGDVVKKKRRKKKVVAPTDGVEAITTAPVVADAEPVKPNKVCVPHKPP